MKTRTVAIVSLVLAVLAGAYGWHLWQEGLVPVALASEAPLFERAQPEFGQDETTLRALLPAGAKLDAFLRAQALEPLVRRLPEDGGWAGLLADQAWRSRNGRTWRFHLKPGLRFHDGTDLTAAWAVAHAARWTAGALHGGLKEARLVDPLTFELRLLARQDELLPALADPSCALVAGRSEGTGPFRLDPERRSLRRFDGFREGKAGVAGLDVATDPALLEGRAWAESLMAGRWDFTAFPGAVPPDAMAQVRRAPYDELRLSGAVWFASRKLRRFRPDAKDWSRSALFGVWRGAMDLERDALS